MFVAATAGALLMATQRTTAADMSDAPVLRPDRPWEGQCAMPFSGGIWKVGASYRCWYLAYFKRICLAYSEDGLTWTKPDLGVVLGTNIVLEPSWVDTVCVWPNPAGGFVMSLSTAGGGPLRVLTSPDGIHWHSRATVGEAGDRTTLFYNHLTDRWVYCVRAGMGLASVTHGRRIDRVVSETLIPSVWQPEPWLRAHVRDGASAAAGGQHQLYALDVAPDGDRLLGFFTIYRGEAANRPKLNDVCVGISTDGETFARSFAPILTRSDVPQAWNYGNVQGVTGGAVRIGDRYRVYASGRAGVPQAPGNGVCSMGYATVTL